MRNLRAQPQATAISGPPGGGEEEQAPTLPPLPARLCPPRKHGLPPDDMAGALASALNSVAAGGGGSEVPSRQVSLDAVAALLQLPQAFAGATPGGPAPPQLPTRPGQQRGQPPHPDRHRRGAQRESSPSPKRARTIGVQSPATPIGQMPQALLLSAPGGEVAAPNQLQGLGPGHGWQAAVLAQLLGTAASQPTPHSGGSAVLPGSTAPSSPRSPRQQAPMQGQQAVPGEPRTGGQGRAAAADPGEVQQQLLLDLLAAVPDSQRGLQAEGGPQAPGPDTPRSTGSDHKAAGTAAWLGSAESPVSGLLRPPGNQPPPGGQVPLLVSRNASPGPCDAGAVAGTSTTLAGLASDPAAAAVHRLWSSAVAAPMPPLPPPPPAAAAAAAVARAGLPMLPEQRQATFEHSVGVLVWMMQQLQHQAFQQSTAATLQQQQLAVLQAWAQKVRGCLRQMQQGWRELLAAMQAAVGEQAGQLRQHDAALQTVLAVQQQLAQALVALQKQAQQADKPAAAGDDGVGLVADQPGAKDGQDGSRAGGHAAKQESEALRRRLALLLEAQEEQQGALQQLGDGLRRERQLRQQLQAELEALQVQVEQQADGAVAAADPAAAPAGQAAQPAGLQAEREGPGSGPVADQLARAGSSEALP